MLLLSVMSIWFVPSGRLRTIYGKFVFTFLALLALPWMADMLAKLTYPTFAWRWLWIAPVSLFASIAVAGLFGMVRERSDRIYAVVLLAVSLIAFIQMDPRIVISESNGAKVSWPGYKIDVARGREEGRPDNQIYLRNRQEWAVIDNGWLLVESVGQRF